MKWCDQTRTNKNANSTNITQKNNFPLYSSQYNYLHSLQGTQVHLESLEDKTPKANFNPPLCTLKKISSEVIRTK